MSHNKAKNHLCIYILNVEENYKLCWIKIYFLAFVSDVYFFAKYCISKIYKSYTSYSDILREY